MQPTASARLLGLLCLLTSLTDASGQSASLPNQSQFSGRERVPGAPNILLIVADDFGVDMLSAYGEGSAPPCTPNIDRLAAEGMLFRNAWANPTCSPTRASMLTGRYGFRTGIGQPEGNVPLSTTESIMPEMLVGFETRCVGKWHLNGNGSAGLLHPNTSGFDYYAGGIGGGLPSYSQWNKITNGSSAMSNTYATRDTADEAISAILQMQEPWFLYTSFNAPHTPFHEPPQFFCDTSDCAHFWCGNLGPNPSNASLAKAMVEAMDAEIGRVLTALDSTHPDTIVVFAGDNGTSGMASQAPFVGSHAKGSMYEGGINVPLIVRGPGVRHAECDALVSIADLYETFGALASRPAVAEDSVSMAPYFSNPNQSLRSTVYSEKFSPNGSGPYTTHERAVRNGRYKLIRRIGQVDELFDLELDPFETSSLLPNLTVAEQVAYDELVTALIQLGVG